MSISSSNSSIRSLVFLLLAYKSLIIVLSIQTKLGLKVNEFKKNNEYLNESIDKFNNKINALNIVIEVKDKTISKLKRDLDESEKAFTNLLKKQKK